MGLRFAASLLIVLALTGCAKPPKPPQICGWLVETNKPDDAHVLDLWLQSDVKLSFLYKIGGEGIKSEAGKYHSPASGTFTLDPGKAATVWGFGSTLDAPGNIDIAIEVHQMPASALSDETTPLLAKFSFQRDVPAGEEKAPPTLATKQCVVLKNEK